MPRIMLATLCLNEIEWLSKLYQQHKHWPGLVGWCFVESADRVYAEANPTMVSSIGLSKDGTSEYLEEIALTDSNISYIPKGFSEHKDPAQGKCASRNCYLEVAERLQPDFVIVLDADEFYSEGDQHTINRILSQGANCRHAGFMFKQRHIWRPSSIIQEPLMAKEVTGGYWNIPHCRVWKWEAGMRYTSNHNTPQYRSGMMASQTMRRYDNLPNPQDYPQCVHLGFASDVTSRAAKHRYYVSRGEGRNDRRQSYVDCRHAFEVWQPNDQLPHGASVIPYTGPVPEVFEEVRTNE